jgi:hypothetical protein
VTVARGPLEATIARTLNGVLLAVLEPAALGLLELELVELELHAASPRLARASAEATIAVGCLIMIAFL